MIRRVILAAAIMGCGAVTSVAPAALAQGLPNSRSELAYSYAPLVKRVSPAVVNIYTTTTARVQRACRSHSPACRSRAASGCRTRWAPACWWARTG